MELSIDEQKKYEVIKSLAHHDNQNKQRAALTLGCTVRHVNRMLKGYHEKGREYFVHGNRGRKPANTINDDTRRLVVDLYRTKYYDANFQHYTELLAKHEGISISTSSVAKILEEACILSPKVTKAKEKRIKKKLTDKKKAAKTQKEADAIQTNMVAVEDAHSRRPRAAYFGELLQMDAAPYEWVPGQIWHLHLAIDDANEFLNSHIKEFNKRFSLPLNGIKSVFVEQPSNEKINLILAVLWERVVDSGHCLQHSKKYYHMLDQFGMQIHYRKGTRVMFIQAFDGKKYCCVNDKDIYGLEEIPEHEAKSKKLDPDYKEPKPQKKYISPMNHPWRRQSFKKFVKQQEHHWNNAEE